MTTITAKQFIEAARERGIHATEVPEHARNDFPVVNIWADDGIAVRYPIASIGWPDPSREQFNTFAWGHHYEFAAPPDVSLADLLDAVVASLPELEG